MDRTGLEDRLTDFFSRMRGTDGDGQIINTDPVLDQASIETFFYDNEPVAHVVTAPDFREGHRTDRSRPKPAATKRALIHPVLIYVEPDADEQAALAGPYRMANTDPSNILAGSTFARPSKATAPRLAGETTEYVAVPDRIRGTYTEQLLAQASVSPTYILEGPDGQLRAATTSLERTANDILAVTFNPKEQTYKTS